MFAGLVAKHSLLPFVSRGWVDGKDRWKDRSKSEGGWICRTDGKVDGRQGWGGKKFSLSHNPTRGRAETVYQASPPHSPQDPKAENNFLLILALSQIQAI